MTAFSSQIQNLRRFFETGETFDVGWRQSQIDAIIRMLETERESIQTALHQDLGKTPEEAWLTEIGIVLHEAYYARKHVKSWASGRKKHSPIFLFPASSHIQPQPRGLSLIISPWNYPFQLLVSPLIASVAAGNVTLLKPSELAPATADWFEQKIPQFLDTRAFCVVQGGPEETTELLTEKFDTIFFTGSTRVAKFIARAAAENLTPTVLELGGKSPTIIANCKHIQTAAQRIAFAKFVNAGQTCVAPDYVLIQDELQEAFVSALKRAISQQFGQQFERMGHLISERHYRRLKNLLYPADTQPEQTILFGGKCDDDRHSIEPTVVLVGPDHPLMQEEIFGPILPILPISKTHAQIAGGEKIGISLAQKALDIIAQHPTPLACYLFSDDKADVKAFKKLICGGFAHNDALMHLTNIHMPFGGVGTSGHGASHGYQGFLNFSHQRSELMQSSAIDMPLRYPPYSPKSMKLFAWLMK